MRRTENATYQPSRTVKRTISPKGTVRRVSTAVLLDQTVRWEGVGAKARRTLVPPSAEVIKGVHDIIAGITGFIEQRGDQITVETLPFESTLEAEPPAGRRRPGQAVPRRHDFKQPIVIGGAALSLFCWSAGLVFLLLHANAVTGRATTSSRRGNRRRALLAGWRWQRRRGERRMEQQLVGERRAAGADSKPKR